MTVFSWNLLENSFLLFVISKLQKLGISYLFSIYNICWELLKKCKVRFPKLSVFTKIARSKCYFTIISIFVFSTSTWPLSKSLCKIYFFFYTSFLATSTFYYLTKVLDLVILRKNSGCSYTLQNLNKIRSTWKSHFWTHAGKCHFNKVLEF